MIGINASGAEYSWEGFPDDADFAFLANSGMTLVRLPISWERLQPTLGGAFDQNYLGQLLAAVDAAAKNGVELIVDLHNYGRYNLDWATQAAANYGIVAPGGGDTIGSANVPISEFADFWGRLATVLEDKPAITYLGLMNEPHDMGSGDVWPDAAQAAVNAIRAVDMTKNILISGTAWDSAQYWPYDNGNLKIEDPATKLFYEAHVYFDKTGSGNYTGYDADAAYPNLGVDRVQPFLDWLAANDAKGFISEFGVPGNDPRWLTVLQNFVSKLDSAGVSGTYWNYMYHTSETPAWWHPDQDGMVVRSTAAVTAPQLTILQNADGGIPEINEAPTGLSLSQASLTDPVADTTKPVVSTTAPAAHIAAGSASGATVSFAASASDAVDGTDPVTFREGTAIVTSGQTFGLGTHTITVSAADTAGNVADPASFTFTVADTTKPVVSTTAPTVLPNVLDASENGESGVAGMPVGSSSEGSLDIAIAPVSTLETIEAPSIAVPTHMSNPQASNIGLSDAVDSETSIMASTVQIKTNLTAAPAAYLIPLSALSPILDTIILDGHPGAADSIAGNAGSHTVSYFASTHAVSIDLGLHLTWDGSANDFVTSVENAIGSKYKDFIVGDDGNNILDGGGGADHIYGGHGSDTVSFANSTSSVVIDLAAQQTWDGANNDVLSSIENATGSKYDDVLQGDGGDNVLDGGGGADHIYGGPGTDTVSFANSTSGVVIDLAAQQTWDGVKNDVLSSIENAIGSSRDDVIIANTTEVTNILTGGGATDTFVFRAGFGHDVISDFDASGSAHDVIELDHGMFANDNPLGSAQDVGNNVVLIVNGHEDITLIGLHKADLAMGDFHFV